MHRGDVEGQEESTQAEICPEVAHQLKQRFEAGVQGEVLSSTTGQTAGCRLALPGKHNLHWAMQHGSEIGTSHQKITSEE